MKTYKIVLQNAAITDAINAKIWYNKQLKGLGSRFSKDLQNTLLRVSQNPYTFAIRYSPNRKANFETFPYGVFFFIDEQFKTLYVTAVKHSAINFLE